MQQRIEKQFEQQYNAFIPIREQMISESIREWEREENKYTGKSIDQIYAAEPSLNGEFDDLITIKMNNIMKTENIKPKWLALEEQIAKEFNESIETLLHSWVLQIMKIQENPLKLKKVKEIRDMVDNVSHLTVKSISDLRIPVEQYGKQWENSVGQFAAAMKKVNNIILTHNLLIPPMMLSKHKLPYQLYNIVDEIHGIFPTEMKEKKEK
jgi:hypothetical protein